MADTANERIRASAYRMARGELAAPTEDGYCLQAVRLVIEDALWEGRYELYDRLLPVGTSRRPKENRVGFHRLNPWASDFEASIKYLKLAVPMYERRAGDIVFNHLAAVPQGHVGILIERDLVLESVNPAFRPNSIHIGPSLVLTPFENFPITLIGRVPEQEE